MTTNDTKSNDTMIKHERNVFERLANKDTVRLIGDALDSRDRLCFALSCGCFRDQLEQPLVTGMVDVATSIERFEWAAALPGSPAWLRDRTTTRLVARAGALEVLVHLLQHRSDSFAADAECCYEAAAHGRLEVLRYLREELECPWDFRTCREAARGGHAKTLAWARAHGCEWDASICEAAAGEGHLAVLQQAVAEGCDWNPRYVCEAAAEGGHLAVLQWAVEAHGAELDGRVTEMAAQGGHFQVLRWSVVEHGCPVDQHAADSAAKRGDLEMLQWLHRHGCPLGSRTCRQAAAGGHQEVLEWARSVGCDWDESTCYAAAQSGQTATLAWARDHGCPWNARTCQEAARGGHLEALTYAHTQGCPWTKAACYSAAEEGHVDCLLYCIRHGCDWDSYVCYISAKNGYREVLDWARAAGYNLDAIEDVAASDLAAGRNPPRHTFCPLCVAEERQKKVGAQGGAPPEPTLGLGVGMLQVGARCSKGH